ncbi:MAG: hypothetical protein EOP38_20375 [Rubrivivax sp.]|nr:MAG: hypothetical protein EOP38_20375 [Rubrivivax sp.]
MTHSSLSFDDSTHGDVARSGRQLAVEKLGVIAGFLVGLLVGMAAVAEPLASFGLPAWLTVPATVATVALFTWVGHRSGSAAAERFRRAAR